jgi:3-methyladenine DNA glycosylase AlkD
MSPTNPISTINLIKQELRSAMNGVLSAQMRQAGMPYKLIFGVELPRLQEIAREFAPDRSLAQTLWNENIRECKILAVLLMPLDAMCPEIADIWVEEMPTAEIAQISSMHLLSREPWSAELAFHWIASAHAMRQLCGFLIMARLLSQGAELNERAESELRDQAEALVGEANLHLKKAIQAVLERLEQEK